MKRWLVVLTLLGTGMGLSGCGYNTIQAQDEQIKATWSEVINQYQRRADLIPNLVNTVKGYAQQEQDVLLGVTNARAKVGAIQATPELVNDPQAFAKFQQAQGELTSALSRLLVVVENYPQLKSNEAFVQLMDELAGTENRLATERMRYNEEVQGFNVLVKRFPTNLYATVFNFKEATYYQVPEGAKAVPKVDFSGLKK